MEGDFDFASIREAFAQFSSGFSEQYAGHFITDIWLGKHTALLEGEGYIIFGNIDAVKAVLDTLGLESGFLLSDDEPRRVQYSTHFGVDADEYLGMTLTRAHGGFFTKVSRASPVSFRGAGCGSGWSASAGSGSEVRLRIFLPFKQEEDADSNEDKVRAWFETTLSETVKLEGVEMDGLFIVGTDTLDEMDWKNDWTKGFANPYDEGFC